MLDSLLLNYSSFSEVFSFPCAREVKNFFVSPLPFSRLFYRVKVVASSRAGKYSSEISYLIQLFVL